MKPKPLELLGVISSVKTSKLPAFRHALEYILAHPEVCDAVEIRLDAIREHLYLVWAQIVQVAQCKPTILTLRSKECGGHEVISLDDQLAFWDELPEGLRTLIFARDSRVFVDWGLDLHEFFSENVDRTGFQPPFPWRQIIASAHDFEETPSDLPGLLFRLEDTKAGAFLKLVTMAKKGGDSERLMTLCLGRKDPRPLIAFTMGALGEASRFACMGWGSFGTYGYLEGFGRAAPGQVSVQKLMADGSVQHARRMYDLS
jgi:3-dehydroquinate dehydratase type I